MRAVLLPIAAAALIAGAAAGAPIRATGLRAGRGTGQAPATPMVILISLDGYRAGYLARGDNPVLERIAAEGVRARWMVPSFPTVTEPNHYTFLTGLYPDHHGIVENNIQDRDIQHLRFEMRDFASTDNPRWWSEATPLWVSVQRAGMRAAEVEWPDGEVRIDGMVPDLHRNGARVSRPAATTATVVRWLRLPSAARPRLILVHYETVDATGHRYGPDSPQMQRALHDVDDAVGKLLGAVKHDGLYPTTDVVVVSDHGMAAVPPGHEIHLDDMVDLAAIDWTTLGAVASIDPRPTLAGFAAETALLGPHPHMQCWRKQDLPAHLHYGTNGRIPALVCIAQSGWIFTTHPDEDNRRRPLRGEHGYDNRDPAMRAIFIAEGPSFRKGYLSPPFPNVDVYPLLARILKVPPERNDGNFAGVAPLLKPADR